jgi:hypothetical protein
MLHGPLVQLPERTDPERPEVVPVDRRPQVADVPAGHRCGHRRRPVPQGPQVLLWIDEGGEAFPVNQLGPNGRLLLHQSRHYFASPP